MNFISKITNCWKSASRADFLFWSILIVALAPWAYFRSQQATHSDLLWLSEALRRFLDGTPLSDGAYETNPPLSMLLYILPVMAKSWLGIPLHYAIFIQTVTMITLSSLAVYKIMSAWRILEHQTAQIMTIGYILAITIGASLYQGERDHILALGLVPFVLAQITLTLHLPQARGWMKPVFVAGAILILLKPHHGLIPTLLLAHRAIRQRRLSVIFDPDFISLTLAVLGYFTLIFTVFPDYAFIVFPDVVKLYLPMGSLEYVRNTSLWIIALCFGLAFGARAFKIPREERLILLWVSAAAAISLIPYAVQKMGLYYHIIPALAFLFMGISLTLIALLRTEIKTPQIRAPLILIMMIILSYTFAPLNTKYPNHHFFAQTPIAKLVTNCPEKTGCKFFMLNREMGIVHETAYYTNTMFASRFPSPWFIKLALDTEKNMGKGIPGPLTRAEYNSYLDRYAQMTADDLIKFKPHYLIIWDWQLIGPKEGFITFLSNNKDFAAAMKAYQEKGPFQINYIDYYTGLPKAKDEVLNYTIYERKPEYEIMKNMH